MLYNPTPCYFFHFRKPRKGLLGRRSPTRLLTRIEDLQSELDQFPAEVKVNYQSQFTDAINRLKSAESQVKGTINGILEEKYILEEKVDHMMSQLQEAAENNMENRKKVNMYNVMYEKFQGEIQAKNDQIDEMAAKLKDIEFVLELEKQSQFNFAKVGLRK